MTRSFFGASLLAFVRDGFSLILPRSKAQGGYVTNRGYDNLGPRIDMGPAPDDDNLDSAPPLAAPTERRSGGGGALALAVVALVAALFAVGMGLFAVTTQPEPTPADTPAEAARRRVNERDTPAAEPARAAGDEGARSEPGAGSVVDLAPTVGVDGVVRGGSEPTGSGAAARDTAAGRPSDARPVSTTTTEQTEPEPARPRGAALPVAGDQRGETPQGGEPAAGSDQEVPIAVEAAIDRRRLVLSWAP